MPASLYTNGRIERAKGNVDLVNDDIVLLLVDTDFYTVDLENDFCQSDIPEEAQILEVSLTGKTLDGVTFRADEISITGLTEGKIGALVILQNTGYENTSVLLSYHVADNFPVTANGQPITVNFDQGVLTV